MATLLRVLWNWPPLCQYYDRDHLFDNMKTKPIRWLSSHQFYACKQLFAFFKCNLHVRLKDRLVTSTLSRLSSTAALIFSPSASLSINRWFIDGWCVVSCLRNAFPTSIAKPNVLFVIHFRHSCGIFPLRSLRSIRQRCGIFINRSLSLNIIFVLSIFVKYFSL